MKNIVSIKKSIFIASALLVSQISFGNLAVDTLINNNSTLLNEIDAAKKGVPASSESDTINIRMDGHDVKIISNSEVDTILISEPQPESNSTNGSNSINGSKNFNIQVNKNGMKAIFGNTWIGRTKRFKGHYSGFDFGMNRLYETNYSMYPPSTPQFLDLIAGKSFEFNFNFSQYSVGFTPWAGLVTGLGLNFNNYRFSGDNTIFKDSTGMIQPLPIEGRNLKKNKLATVYLNAPLLLEFQIKTSEGNRIFISGGVIGGVNLGAHTKVKVDNEKYKNHRDLNVNQFRWGYTARVGADDFGIFATYYDTKLFKDGMGPQATPFTFGITFTVDD